MQACCSNAPTALALNYDMLGHGDLVNIVLQRSEVLSDVPQPNGVIRDWVAGDPTLMNQVVRSKGSVLAQRAAQVIHGEFEALCPVMDQIKPTYLADIGCGYAFFGLFAHRRYGCDLLLIDVEENDRRHFGFDEEAAAYTSLETARDFLVANGVPAAKIHTWNPELQDAPADDKVDLAVSFLSCGFHFPVDMYVPFFRYGVVPDGAVMLDLRAAEFQENKRLLKTLGHVQVLSQRRGRKRILLRKENVK